MDEQLPSLPSESTNKFFSFGHRILIGITAIFFFLLLFFLVNFFGIYNFSEKVNFLRFLPTREDPFVKEVDTIMSIIQNPDPKLIAKYNVSKVQIEDEQALILCGGYLTSDRKLVLDENICLPNSLVGIKKTIKAKDLPQALTLIQKLYSTVRNSIVRDDNATVRYSLEEALNIDPEKQFLNFPPPPNRPGWGGSAIKQEAAIKTIKLWYLIKSKM